MGGRLILMRSLENYDGKIVDVEFKILQFDMLEIYENQDDERGQIIDQLT